MNNFEKLIFAIAPEYALKREMARSQIESIRRYEAATKGRRTSNWGSSIDSGRVAAGNDIHMLRERSRQLVRDNPYAKRAIDIIKNNVIGDGITATPKKESAIHQKMWEEWALTTNIDYNGKHNIYGLQSLAVRALAESGEVLFRKVRNKDLSIPYQLQILEADFIDDEGHNSGGWYNSENDHFGIRYDKKGKIIGYWLWESHPGDNIFNLKSNLIPASEIIHLYEELRPGQSRGVPMGVSAMTRLKNLDGYEDAQLERQKAAACFVAFVKNGSQKALQTESTGKFHNEKLTPGLIQYLDANEEITFGNPPVTEDAEYVKQVLRAIACGYGISYEALSNDYSNVNFSSGRMGWMESARNTKSIQWDVVIPLFLNKVWDMFELGVEMRVGAKPVGVDWTVPKRIMIDPAKEIKALIEEVRGGFKSWEEAIKENGYDPKQVLIELKRNKEEFEKIGFFPSSIPAFDAERINAEVAAKNQDTNTKK